MIIRPAPQPPAMIRARSQGTLWVVAARLTGGNWDRIRAATVHAEGTR